MTTRPPVWLEPSPPWSCPVPEELCVNLPVTPDQIPLVEVLGAPCTLAEILAVRGGRFVPLFGHGPTRDEAVRALALLVRTYGADADPRAYAHTVASLVHPGVVDLPLVALASAVNEGRCEASIAGLALGVVGLLGTGDDTRTLVAGPFERVPALALEAALARAVGGGDTGRYREHYERLRALDASAHGALVVATAWFDYVLARRWAGLDTLRAQRASPGLDVPSAWLVASAEWLAGDPCARDQLAELAERALAPVQRWLPRLAVQVARELVELLGHPWARRWQHLRCAAARDHASVSIRAWLHAATEAEPDDATLEALGPEPSRAGRDAVAARQLAGEFLLDWFVHDREAANGVDAWAAQALRLYHRLRGITLVARAEAALRPSGGAREGWSRVVWGGEP